MVADFARAQQGGDHTTMDGPPILPDSNCLTFWYQFETIDITVFRVYINDTNDIIFEVEGELSILMKMIIIIINDLSWKM